MSLPYKEGVAGWDRITTSTAAGLSFGAIVGAVKGNWDFNLVRNETSLKALGKTLSVMGATMLAYGGVALVYSGTEAFAEMARGQADWKNGALGGLAAGSVVGVQTGRLGAAASAGVLFCAASMCVDATSGRLRGSPYSEDGTPSNPYGPRLNIAKR